MAYCLIGNPLGHSFSAKIHKQFGYEYELKQLDDSKLEKFVSENKYDGFNVTIPFKQRIIPLLDEIDAAAEKIGAVNTVVKRNGKLYGYNTDFNGMKFALGFSGIKIKGKKVLILGGGGTSKTAKALAEELSAKEVVVVTRNGADNYENLDKHFDSQIIINTTPVGMYPDNAGRIAALGKFKNLSGVFDVVYNPLKTNLVLEAEELEIKSGGGLPMLIAQAFFARDIFLKQTSSESEIKSFVKSFQKGLQNIVLVGMPSSGKTTLGKLIAEKSGREFFDTDSLIAESENLSIEEIFSGKGEKYFRQTEKKIVSDAAKKFSSVISTGGGVILDGENVNALRQNGIIFYVDRDLCLNECEGRPLVKNADDLMRLKKIRAPLYEKAADYKVENNGDKNECAEKILEKFYESAGN